MLHAARVVPVQQVDHRRIIDAVILDHERRRACRGELTGVKGTRFVVDLAAAASLRGGDAFVLDTGDLVEVVAEAERLWEVRAADPAVLARIAWALGDRHVPVQVLPNRIRLRPDAALEAMLKGHGARIAAVDAPFDPEGGAYPTAEAGGEPHGHRHDHDHHRDHHHGPGEAGHDHSHHHHRQHRARPASGE